MELTRELDCATVRQRAGEDTAESCNHGMAVPLLQTARKGTVTRRSVSAGRRWSSPPRHSPSYLTV